MYIERSYANSNTTGVAKAPVMLFNYLQPNNLLNVNVR